MADLDAIVSDCVTDKWFTAMFTGTTSYLKGIVVKPGETYDIRYMGRFGREGWLWFVIRSRNTNPVYKLFLGHREAECPYRDAQSFKDNWKIIDWK